MDSETTRKQNSLIIGTRASKLALAQTNKIISTLKKSYPEIHFQLKQISTTGDKHKTADLSKLGRGSFVKEIERSLLSGVIDIAIHSAKDLTSHTPEGLHIAAFTKREDPRDIQINFEYKNNQIPYFAKGWEELFLKSNNVEKAIYLNYECIKMNKLTKNEIVSSNFSNNFITIPFESFELNPDSYMKKIEKLLESAIINKTIKALKKQKVPRKKIADSLQLAVYKRCGWVPPKKNLNERDELNIRRDFCINQGAGKLAMEKLDEISLQYEKKYCQDMFLF